VNAGLYQGARKAARAARVVLIRFDYVRLVGKPHAFSKIHEEFCPNQSKFVEL
jgi:hypothetical protein